MNNALVKCENLKKQYDKKTALNNLSLSIEENSITGLIGRNGSGKTTLMKILSGQLDKTSGTALVFGENPADNIRVLENLVYTYHNFSYQKDLTLKVILENYDIMFPAFDLDFANKLLKFFELNGKMKYKALSQGMASIFNFLAALSCRCKLTMFDEPVLGMDITVRKAAYDILLREYAENPRTFIISSHLLSELEGVLSDILLIENGEKLLHSNIDIMRNSAYRIDGDWTKIQKYIAGKKIIALQNSPMQSFAVVYEPLSETVKTDVLNAGLDISPVHAEDLYVYLTKQNKEEALKCLW